MVMVVMVAMVYALVLLLFIGNVHYTIATSVYIQSPEVLLPLIDIDLYVYGQLPLAICHL